MKSGDWHLEAVEFHVGSVNEETRGDRSATPLYVPLHKDVLCHRKGPI